MKQIPAQRFEQRNVPILQTERLTLRAPRRGDGKAIVRLANDRRIAENTARIPHPYHLGDAETFIAAANREGDEATFVIMREDELIGMCGVEPRQDGPEIGYWVGAPFWGRGFATEAVRAVIDHSFGALGHQMLQAASRVSNPSSRRVLEKCGFQWTGVGLYRVRAINSSAPFDRFRFDRGLWASLKAWGQAREVA
jgi:RimJ/RimL family protein N-acetyltransferase